MPSPFEVEFVLHLGIEVRPGYNKSRSGDGIEIRPGEVVDLRGIVAPFPFKLERIVLLGLSLEGLSVARLWIGTEDLLQGKTIPALDFGPNVSPPPCLLDLPILMPGIVVQLSIKNLRPSHSTLIFPGELRGRIQQGSALYWVSIASPSEGESTLDLDYQTFMNDFAAEKGARDLLPREEGAKTQLFTYGEKEPFYVVVYREGKILDSCDERGLFFERKGER